MKAIWKMCHCRPDGLSGFFQRDCKCIALFMKQNARRASGLDFSNSRPSLSRLRVVLHASMFRLPILASSPERFDASTALTSIQFLYSSRMGAIDRSSFVGSHNSDRSSADIGSNLAVGGPVRDADSMANDGRYSVLMSGKPNLSCSYWGRTSLSIQLKGGPEISGSIWEGL